MAKRYEMYEAPECDVEVVGPGADLDRDEDELAEDLGLHDHALVLGNPWATAFAAVGTEAQLRAFVGRLDGELTARFGYRHPLMLAAADALAEIGVNAQAAPGPCPGAIVLEAGLPDGTRLGVYPGKENRWPSSQDPTWHFTGWFVLHDDPATDAGVSAPIGVIDGPADPRAESFACPQALAEIVGLYLVKTGPKTPGAATTGSDAQSA